MVRKIIRTLRMRAIARRSRKLGEDRLSGEFSSGISDAKDVMVSSTVDFRRRTKRDIQLCEIAAREYRRLGNKEAEIVECYMIGQKCNELIEQGDYGLDTIMRRMVARRYLNKALDYLNKAKKMLESNGDIEPGVSIEEVTREIERTKELLPTLK